MKLILAYSSVCLLDTRHLHTMSQSLTHRRLFITIWRFLSPVTTDDFVLMPYVHTQLRKQLIILNAREVIICVPFKCQQHMLPRLTVINSSDTPIDYGQEHKSYTCTSSYLKHPQFFTVHTRYIAVILWQRTDSYLLCKGVIWIVFC